MKKLTVVLALTFFCFLSPTYGQWQKHVIDSSIAYSCFIDVHDMGDDNDIDIFLAEYDANTILWYENDNMTWIKHTIDNNIPGVVGLDLMDVNNDGNMDVIVAAWSSNLVAWYENDGADSVSWIPHTIVSDFAGAEVVRVQDINSDGVLDIVVAGDPGRLAWYENNYPAEWICHDISSNVPGGLGNFYVGDVNNDNKPDIVRNSGYNVVLFINNLPDTEWTRINIDGDMPGTFHAHIADINNGGHMDVAATAQEATGPSADVAWYENDGSGLNWTKHPITADLEKARCLFIEDMDNNGYMDVIVGDYNEDKIIVFFNNDGGQSWTENNIDSNFDAPNPVFAFDIDLDNDFDVIATSRVNNALNWYENLPDSTVYPESFEISPYSVQSQADTLFIRTEISNPENHSASAFAVIQGEQFAFMDTLQLFDDGLHIDSLASDNIWGNFILASGIPEDSYIVDLFTYDSIYDIQFDSYPQQRFITFGPVAYEGHSFTFIDTIPNPDDRVDLKLTLKNNGISATATDIKARLTSLEPSLLSIPDYSRRFNDIAAGESSTCSDIFVINISDTCPVNTEIPIEVNISSYDHVCWVDTFSIMVLPVPDNIKNIKQPVAMIYPNPTSGLLTIEMDNTDNGTACIEIYNLTGKMLLGKEYRSDKPHFIQQIDVSAYHEGIYFVRIVQADAVAVRKIVVK